MFLDNKIIHIFKIKNVFAKHFLKQTCILVAFNDTMYIHIDQIHKNLIQTQLFNNIVPGYTELGLKSKI